MFLGNLSRRVMMARRSAEDVTETELAILQVLWERGEATRRQIADVLYPGGGEAHYATVQNLLLRLERKGFVRHDQGGVLVFSAMVDRDELISPAPGAGRSALRGSNGASGDEPGAAQPLSEAEVDDCLRFCGGSGGGPSLGAISLERSKAVDLLLRHGLCNAAWAAALAFVAVLGSRLFRHRPALCHLLWLLVLLKLIVPSFFWLSVPDRDRSPRREQDLAKMTTSPEPLAAPRVKEDRSVSLPASGPARTLPDVMIQSSSRSWRWQTAVLAVWLAGGRVLVVAHGLEPRVFSPAHAVRQGARFAAYGSSAAACRSPGITRAAGNLVAARTRAAHGLGATGGRASFDLAGGTLAPAEERAARYHPGPRTGAPETTRSLGAAVAALACGLYWWDPFAWWARRELERAEEQCCDAWVLRVLPHAASDYAESLVATAAFLAGLRSPLPPAASGVGRLIPLQRRLQMIMRDDTTGPVALALPRVLLIAGALCLLFLPAFASSPGQPRESQVAAAPVQGLSKEAPTLPRSSQSPVEQEPGKAEADEPRKSSPPGAGSERLPKVKVAHPIEREISDYTILAGHFEAGREIDLKPRVSGTVVSVSCRLGQAVKAGDVLCQIDPRSYQAELNKAQAEYDRAEAHQARWAIDLNAAKKQAADHVISQQEVQPRRERVPGSSSFAQSRRVGPRPRQAQSRVHPSDGTVCRNCHRRHLDGGERRGCR